MSVGASMIPGVGAETQILGMLLRQRTSEIGQ